MLVISVAGKILTPLVVLPGLEAKYRKQKNGKYETPADFLPWPNYLFMRPVAGVDTNILLSWAKYFVKETKNLRFEGKKVLY